MKKLFSIFILTSILGLSFARAEEEGGENPPELGKNFEEHKANRITRLDEKIKELQAAKACMSNAKNHEEMKACHHEGRKEHEDKEEHGKNGQERKEFREGRRGDRKKMREERRNKRGGQSSSSDAQQ